MTTTPILDDLVKQLHDPSSAKRRSAAKKLRKVGDASAGPVLIRALTKEVQDPRTWETQYQMIMALAVSQPTIDATTLFERLLTLDLEPMVHLAAGDAIVRVSNCADEAVTQALRSNSVPRAEGAMRAIAMNRHIPSESTIDVIIEYAQKRPYAQIRFWVAAAAAGWPLARVRAFLQECLMDESEETRRAAQAALDRRYLNWNPL